MEKELLPLYEYFPGDEYVIARETDIARIAGDLKSMSSTAWAQGPIGKTGFYTLHQCSPHHKGDKRLVVVATVADVERAKAL